MFIDIEACLYSYKLVYTYINPALTGDQRVIHRTETPKKGETEMRGKLLFIVGLLLITVFTSGIVNAAEKTLAKSDISKILIETSKELNANLPVMVDKETRADMTMAVGNQLHYIYTMINVAVKDIDKNAFTKEMRSTLVTNQCNNEYTLKLLKWGVSFYYLYLDKNGINLSTIKISKKDCAN